MDDKCIEDYIGLVIDILDNIIYHYNTIVENYIHKTMFYKDLEGIDVLDDYIRGDTSSPITIDSNYTLVQLARSILGGGANDSPALYSIISILDNSIRSDNVEDKDRVLTSIRDILRRGVTL